jgi:hypothetical protein
VYQVLCNFVSATTVIDLGGDGLADHTASASCAELKTSWSKPDGVYVRGGRSLMSNPLLPTPPLSVERHRFTHRHTLSLSLLLSLSLTLASPAHSVAPPSPHRFFLQLLGAPWRRKGCQVTLHQWRGKGWRWV